MLAGDIAKRQRRSERDAWPRIIAVHDRAHVVAAGIEAFDDSAVFSQHPGMAIRLQADGGAEIGGIDAKRVERRPFDRRHAWIGFLVGVAEVTLIDGRATPEFRIAPFPGMGVIVL